MNQFFADDDIIEVTSEIKDLVDRWAVLMLEQKAAVLQLLKTYENSIYPSINNGTTFG